MDHQILTKSHILKKEKIHPNWFNRPNKRWAPLQNIGKNIHKAKIQDVVQRFSVRLGKAK